MFHGCPRVVRSGKTGGDYVSSERGHPSSLPPSLPPEENARQVRADVGAGVGGVSVAPVLAEDSGTCVGGPGSGEATTPSAGGVHGWFWPALSTTRVVAVAWSSISLPHQRLGPLPIDSLSSAGSS